MNPNQQTYNNISGQIKNSLGSNSSLADYLPSGYGNVSGTNSNTLPASYPITKTVVQPSQLQKATSSSQPTTSNSVSDLWGQPTLTPIAPNQSITNYNPTNSGYLQQSQPVGNASQPVQMGNASDLVSLLAYLGNNQSQSVNNTLYDPTQGGRYYIDPTTGIRTINGDYGFFGNNGKFGGSQPVANLTNQPSTNNQTTNNQTLTDILSLLSYLKGAQNQSLSQPISNVNNVGGNQVDINTLLQNMNNQYRQQNGVNAGNSMHRYYLNANGTIGEAW
jgi:hypothetical protein